MVTEVERDALVTFAKDPVDEGYGRLEPWTSENSLNYKPGTSHLGGPEFNREIGVSFPYEPMTPEEFSKYSGEKLDPAEDPGGPAGFWDWMGDYEIVNGRYEDPWLRYYDAIEGTGEATTYDPPGYAPWTEEIQKDWSDAVDNRCAEVDTLRSELTFLMEKLVEVGEKYGDADISNEVKLSEYDFEGDS